ncbi:MAG: sulfite exporter TauE/SafE family protein, partial [Epsilonproteobacteria bacterium]|nr:sulfite exporter TauE/SafE family protein [Campylobacterota bacterium]
MSLIIAGLVVGFISGFFGVGGGTILVPTLLYLGFDIKHAIGISVMQMLFSSLYGSYLNHKKGSLVLKEGYVLGIGGFIGALGSGAVVHFFPGKTLSLIFLAIIIFAIYRFFKAPAESNKPEINSPYLLFFIGMGVGLLAISVGVGGSILLTPILVGFLHYNVKKAISMALFFVVFSSLSGFISLSFYGYIDYLHGFIIGITS